jgi:hypothetical protein
MKCLSCGAICEKTRGNISINDRLTGPFVAKDVEYFKCKKCGEHFFPAETSKMIDASRREALDGLLSSFPISDFLSQPEAYAYLGISRQAFHKNKRIKRGFIYQYERGGTLFYLKRSVQAYLASGDGRFPLHEDVATYKWQIIQFPASQYGGRDSRDIEPDEEALYK